MWVAPSETGGTQACYIQRSPPAARRALLVCPPVYPEVPGVRTPCHSVFAGKYTAPPLREQISYRSGSLL